MSGGRGQTLMTHTHTSAHTHTHMYTDEAAPKFGKLSQQRSHSASGEPGLGQRTDPGPKV